MNNIYLCGHTGSENRGCEAIIRSTAYILNRLSVTDVSAMTFDYDYDCFLHLNDVVNLLPYKAKPVSIKAISYIKRKFLNDGTWGSKYIHKDLFSKLNKGDIIFNVGGDTYCYHTPYISYALNEMASSSKIPSVFWGCSVDERLLNNNRMKEDLNKYSYIVARETLSYNIIKKSISDDKKLFLACDPAFWLEDSYVELPEYFIENNTVGINLSPLIFSDCNNPDDIICQNINCLIDYIINKTQMNICLIPHVYNIERNTQDIKVLRTIFERYKSTKRVCIVSDELSCTQLKYIISKCRFFIGARTHTMIAAYSSCVPALALSYSIKSIGIANDLFGNSGKYVVSRKDLINVYDLKEIFIENLIKQEEEILDLYRRTLPEYKNSIFDVTNKLLNSFKKD